MVYKYNEGLSEYVTLKIYIHSNTILEIISRKRKTTKEQANIALMPYCNLWMAFFHFFAPKVGE